MRLDNVGGITGRTAAGLCEPAERLSNNGYNKRSAKGGQLGSVPRTVCVLRI